MKKTWVFFKLRMLQLRYDKTALFFSYVFPVLLLVIIGYVNQGGDTLTIHYSNTMQNERGMEIINSLESSPLLDLKPVGDQQPLVDTLIRENKIKHYLTLSATDTGEFYYEVRHNNIDENAIENIAVDGFVQKILPGGGSNSLVSVNLESEQKTSYLQILLPGLIGMTLLIIGLNGFGNVLIEEEHRGLFKNIKTISASPMPFLAGLFLSRLLVCYSVAVILFLIGVYVFNVSTHINYLLLFIIVTLGTVSFLGLGLMLSAISPSVSAFTGIVNFVQLPFVVLGGVFVSVSAFPEWIQFISNLIPLTSMNIAMQKIMFESSSVSIGQLSSELLVLGVWCFATLIISSRNFKW